MAGKLFPETYIGDSEDVCKKTPPGKKHLVPQRDIRSASPPSLENKSQEDSLYLADLEEVTELPSESEGSHHGDVEFAREESAGPAPESPLTEEAEENQKHLKAPSTKLFDFKREKEKKEGTQHYVGAGQAPGEMGSQESLTKSPVCHAQEGLWPPPGDNTKEHLEPRVNEVLLIDSFESDWKQTASPGIVSLDQKQTANPGIVSLDRKQTASPGIVSLDRKQTASPGIVSLDRKQTASPGIVSLDRNQAVSPGIVSLDRKQTASPGIVSLDQKQTASPGIVSSGRTLNSPLDPEDDDLCDEAHLKESSASRGYFPCYRTYVEFPQYQSPAAEGRPESKGTCRDASVQCDGFLLETVGEKRGAEANNNSKETKVALHDASPWGQPHGRARPASEGRRLEGSSRRSRLHGDSGQEVGGNPRESALPPKPHTAGSSPSRSDIKLGTAKVAPRSEPWSSPLVPLPATSMGRKSSQKRKHRSSQTDDKDSAKSMELKPLLHDQHSLPPNLEEKAGPLPVCCFSTEAAGESKQARPTMEREHEPCQRAPSVQSGSPPTESPGSPPEPQTASSRLSFHSLVSWVWRIFRKPTQPQPSTSTGTTTSRRPLGSRLRLWLAQHSARVYPEPS